MKTRVLCLVTGALGIASGVCNAQNADRPKDRPTDPSRQSALQTAPSRPDAILAAWLLADNEKELAISELALQKASNAEVKEFATRMIKDHQAMIGKLQRFAPAAVPGSRGAAPLPGTESKQPDSGKGLPSDKPATGDSPRPPTTGTKSPQDAEGRSSSESAGMLDIVELKKDLSQQCLATTKGELEKKPAPEFDQCFMFHQVQAHFAAVDTMTVFKRRASAELGNVLAEGLTTVKAHLEHAKSLAKKLDKAGEKKPALGN